MMLLAQRGEAVHHCAAVPLCLYSAVQIPQLVINGGRPAVPSRPELPGPDTSQFSGLDAYLQLMR